MTGPLRLSAGFPPTLRQARDRGKRRTYSFRAAMQACGRSDRSRDAAMARVVEIEQGLHLGRLDGVADMVALDLAAAFAGEDGELLAGLHAFGRGHHAELLRQLDRRLHDREAIAGAGEVGDEAAVDLDLAERERAQVAEARVAGAEVVERDVDA